jgi:hypothetical protein
VTRFGGIGMVIAGVCGLAVLVIAAADPVRYWPAFLAIGVVVVLNVVRLRRRESVR